MIAIIDYGMGNLASVYNAFLKVGETNVKISSDPAEIAGADKLLLPGVGAFEDAMKNLRASGIDKVIRSSVNAGKPFLGICLGYQLMFERSFENGQWEGLGLLGGDVVRFEVDLPVPEMGWNTAHFIKKEGIFSHFEKDSYFYFDHAYIPVLKDSSDAAAVTQYGVEFVSAVNRGNIFGTQFHPEKSHEKGLSIVEAFARL